MEDEGGQRLKNNQSCMGNGNHLTQLLILRMRNIRFPIISILCVYIHPNNSVGISLQSSGIKYCRRRLGDILGWWFSVDFVWNGVKPLHLQTWQHLPSLVLLREHLFFLVKSLPLSVHVLLPSSEIPTGDVLPLSSTSILLKASHHFALFVFSYVLERFLSWSAQCQLHRVLPWQAQSLFHGQLANFASLLQAFYVRLFFFFFTRLIISQKLFWNPFEDAKCFLLCHKTDHVPKYACIQQNVSFFGFVIFVLFSLSSFRNVGRLSQIVLLQTLFTVCPHVGRFSFLDLLENM